MPPENNPQQGGDTPPDDQQPGIGDGRDWSQVPSWAREEYEVTYKELRDANSESASRRHEIAELRSQLEGLTKAQQKKLEEEGNFKALAEQRAAELAELQPYKTRAETLEQVIRESNEARIAQVREDLRPLIPQDYPPEKLRKWLDANERLLTTPPAPNLDAGAGGSGGQKPPVKLTEEERAMARLFGMSDEEYAKFKRSPGSMDPAELKQEEKK